MADRERCAEAFEAYCEWRGGVRLEMLATEISMVSEKHRYGGTLDAVAHQRQARYPRLENVERHLS